MKLWKTLLIIFNLLTLINTAHFGIFSTFPFLKRKKIEKKNSKNKHKFLILIAARNEEKVIGNLIDSLNNQNYDKSLYKICVIPNNCIDDTEKIVNEKKCMTLKLPFCPKTKGEVLNYAFNYFKNDDSFDTYAIFDADNIVSKNFLKYMNIKLNNGYKIVQGFRDTKNIYENFISGSYAIFFFLQSLFIYTTRTRINEGSTINGTGYVVLKSFINKINYRATTVTEDIELTCCCALNNEKIGYEENAIFYDEQVTNFKVSMLQRKRWIQGSMQVFKNYYKELFKEIKNYNSFQLIDMFQFLFLPINQIFVFIILILSYIFLIPLNFIILGFIISYIGEVLLSIFITIYYKKSIKKLFSACLFFPIFHISWLPLYIYSIFNTNNNWEEIKHTNALKIEEVIED